jgi:hypothetical protein
MYRTGASYLAIATITGAILGGIACDKESGSNTIAGRSDAGKPAPDMAKADSEEREIALVRAVEYATGANHDSTDVDWGAIEDVNAMWSIAAMTTTTSGQKAFATSQNKSAAPNLMQDDRPAYSDCEATIAQPSALNDLLPVLFQHNPAAEASAHWKPLRRLVSGAELVSVTCRESPRMIVGIHDGKVVAARESLSAALELQPRDRPTDESDPEPGGPAPATIAVTSPVDGARIEFDGTEAELPHQLTGVETSKTLRFKVKAPGHLDSEVGALPMDVLTMLQGGEPQTEFEWVVWPNAAE